MRVFVHISINYIYLFAQESKKPCTLNPHMVIILALELLNEFAIYQNVE